MAPPKALSVDPPLMTLPASADFFFYKKNDVWDVIPSTAVRPRSLGLAELPVTQVSVERLFSPMNITVKVMSNKLTE